MKKCPWRKILYQDFRANELLLARKTPDLTNDFSNGGATFISVPRRCCSRKNTRGVPRGCHAAKFLSRAKNQHRLPPDKKFFGWSGRRFLVLENCCRPKLCARFRATDRKNFVVPRKSLRAMRIR